VIGTRLNKCVELIHYNGFNSQCLCERNALIFIMSLYYQQYPEQPAIGHSDQSPIIIIPGLFGSTVNWRSFARQLAKDYVVYVIDLRNHGESPQFGSHTYVDMVADVLALIDELGLPKVTLCGHSMGGKVAMTFALQHPDRIDRLAVLDIAPVTYKHSHAPFVKAMMGVDLLALESRSDAERQLQDAIPEASTRLFLMQSLVGTPGNYRWKLNLPVLFDYMFDIVGFPDQALAGLTSDVESVFIVGGASDYVLDEHYVDIERYFSRVSYAKIDGAGHWLHAEQPKNVLGALMGFLENDK